MLRRLHYDTIILIAAAGAFALAALFLSGTLAEQFRSATYWSVAFVHPAAASHDFVITNNTPHTAFVYTVTDAAGDSVAHATVTVPQAAVRTVRVQVPRTARRPLTITVTHRKQTHVLRK